jgi:hypothetical protein
LPALPLPEASTAEYDVTRCELRILWLVGLAVFIVVIYFDDYRFYHRKKYGQMW